MLEWTNLVSEHSNLSELPTDASSKEPSKHALLGCSTILWPSTADLQVVTIAMIDWSIVSLVTVTSLYPW